MSIGSAVKAFSTRCNGILQRSPVRSVIVGLCILMLLAGCGRRAPAAPAATAALPTVTPTEAITAALTPRPTPRGDQPVVFTSPRHGYTVTLPCCWVGMPAPGLVVEEVMAEMRQTPESETGAVAELPDETLAEALELIAILPNSGTGGAPEAQLTVSVLAGHGLTLDTYLAATSAELNAMTNTEVQSAYLDDSLRPDHLPVAVIEYRTQAARPIAGLQIAFYLQDAGHLVVLTFTTTEASYAALADDFADIARSVTLTGAPAVPSSS